MTSLAKGTNLNTSLGRLHDPSSGSNTESLSVRDIAQDFLLRCNIPYPSYTPDLDYEKECCDVAIKLGYPMSGNPSLRPFIPGGTAMSETAYAHIGDKQKRIFIAIYTAVLIYMDDVFEHDIQSIRDFNLRFVQNERQSNSILEAFAKMLLELPSLYNNNLVGNLMITSTLNLVSALLLECETRGMNVSAEAINYPAFSRVMSGASEAYALFAFPPELPLAVYIQAVPDIMIFINQGNDVLSFYKEDLAGDTIGYVPLVAAIKGIPNIQALCSVSDEAVEAYDRSLRILAPNPKAYDACLKLSQGLVGFHAAIDRYRLNELNLK